ncbi:Bug family tripartite tricarboxylate transporter substrate binding protein [Paracraurococcus lichenis]|uniref:Tripartite tricarboxylate transporter substrate binding protein n=1 Tax=Paracraurococcus lichenis TaxID=3064888 RepID=A0ABT9DTF1_9PROT|nr:tripartite tricarboxylate transporter substrate binding protein [Paracraurococcus sp. LOR1-02]MDO9707172.1 tripartite tricarboxylate transporter substrate binding protein [Paracraurococcus sp. LOR1-02]
MQGRIGRRPMLGALGGALAASRVAAQGEWRPDRPVRMIVPSGPGSGADVIARALAMKLAESFGQGVVVENLNQGVGAVGILAAARARPDGHTLMCSISSILLAPLVDPSLSYDVRQFMPVSQLHQAATVLVVPPQVPARTLQQFLALVRAQPERFILADYGHGTASHINAALLIKRAGLGNEIVHYTNTPNLIRDLIADHIRCGIVDSASGMQSIRDGQVHALAVSGRRRLGVLGEIPTFGELGFPGFEPAPWQAVFLPQGTPAPIAAVIERAVRQAVAAPDFAARLRGLGFEPVGGSAEDLAQMLASERETWAAVIAETGIRPA